MTNFKIIRLGIFIFCIYLSLYLNEQTYQTLNSQEQEQIQHLSKDFIYRFAMPSAIIYLSFMFFGMIFEDYTSLSLNFLSTFFEVFTSFIILFLLLSYYKKLRQWEIPKNYIISWLRITALTLVGIMVAWSPLFV